MRSGRSIFELILVNPCADAGILSRNLDNLEPRVFCVTCATLQKGAHLRYPGRMARTIDPFRLLLVSIT
jgi:hypothetical protein